MNVWLVFVGEHSDRHVVAVTDSEERASHVAASVGSNSVEVFEVNEIADRLLAGYRRWQVKFLRTVESTLLNVRMDFQEVDLGRPTVRRSYGDGYGDKREVIGIFVDARDENEAIKIASDVRRQYVAEGMPSEWPQSS